MAIKIVIANQKGGTGKTTTVLNLGAALAEKGKHVLLVDLDPQANLSMGLGCRLDEGEPSIYQAMLSPDVSIRDILFRDTGIDGVHLAPASIDLTAAELQLVMELNRERVLAVALEEVDPDYDFILIDCPPSLGLLTLNGMTAANQLIVPVQCGFWALRGMGQLFDTVERVRASKVNPALELLGILLTMYDRRTSLSQQIEQRVIEAFGDKVFKARIMKTVRFDYSSIEEQSILQYDPTSEVAQAYRSVAEEVLERNAQKA
ncbi:MAG: ParA family protein [Armatimonadetes bacterium]|nr:ParA family protein [Armatimonadota bacterium]